MGLSPVNCGSHEWIAANGSSSPSHAQIVCSDVRLLKSDIMFRLSRGLSVFNLSLQVLLSLG